ncbi:class I SAM-dependent RNA methyltransferase [Persephonella sp.]
MMKVIIEKLVYGGKGLGRLDDKVCFVPYVLPSEEVEVRITKEKKSFMECEPVEVLKPSPDRVEPPCRYFTYCGGCDYLHIKYQKQVEIKNHIFTETLERLGKIKEIPLREPVPSKPDLHYRNRVQLKVKRDKIGFFKRESREVVNIDSCLLLKEELNYALEGLREVLPFFGFAPLEVHLHSSSEGQMTARFIFRKPLRRIPLGLKHMRAFLGEYLEGFGIYVREGAFPRRVSFVGSPFAYEVAGDYKFRVSADSFFQVNRFQVENLINMVEEIIRERQPSVVVDLYSGVGTFSIPAAKYAQKVYGVEINPYAVQDANHNRKINGVKNVTFNQSPASRVLEYTKKKNPELIIVDPPRGGLDEETIRAISSIENLKTIVYISCNPSTLARDISILGEKGFELQSTGIIDMFPHTYHIESLTLLEKLR